MNAEIEKILEEDDAAREIVDAARIEAKRLVDQAREEAQAILDQAEQDRARYVRANLEIILEEARARTARVRGDADRYLESLKEKKEAIWGDLLDELLRKVMGS